tara:strand:+ start:171 stop:284 length:114 start_codon:yes stop_codon:yes gene_type:complete
VSNARRVSMRRKIKETISILFIVGFGVLFILVAVGYA